ncbi:copper resistance CopC family protein [Cellulomonas sp. ICMP 17802]|uniref:copper resistance CopC family protein n=1 Tax=Cellulomonas sp. ICMP 17802 TaxID=3239199 RepID=UPI00351BD51F
MPSIHPSSRRGAAALAGLVPSSRRGAALLAGLAPSSRRGAALLAGLVLGLAGTVAGASAAQAHNQLQGTDPADGAAVEVVPDHVTLTFDEPALALGTEIVVNAPDQRPVSTGPAVLVDNTVTQAITGVLPAGVYTVIYRVTSDDGHPVEGQFTFTAANDTSYGVASPTPAPTVSAAADPSPAATPTPPPAPAPAPAQRHVSGGLLLGSAAGLVLVGGVVAWLVLRRRQAP